MRLKHARRVSDNPLSLLNNPTHSSQLAFFALCLVVLLYQELADPEVTVATYLRGLEGARAPRGRLLSTAAAGELRDKKNQ